MTAKQTVNTPRSKVRERVEANTESTRYRAALARFWEKLDEIERRELQEATKPHTVN